MHNHNFHELEKKIEVEFKNEELFKAAITHSSYANQRENVKYNERLEFLGDSVLQIVISEYLFLNYKDKLEGELSKKRSLIVCENSLYKIAKKWDLGIYMLMSNGEEMTGGRERVSILSDCVEAIIAAIYLDHGMEFIKDFILRDFENIIKLAMEDKIVLDFKTKLQEVLQKNGETQIEYDLIKFEGPPHRRKFYISVSFNGKVQGNGEGFSKKEGEQNAAQNALIRMDKIYG
ncbi:MAG: ribonuclease III [Clostridium sp.]|nr:ribonuclease III [Clostridium sp.]